jgi:hypothetical protein
MERVKITLETPEMFAIIFDAWTAKHIKAEDIPEGCFKYQIRHHDKDESVPYAIEEAVTVNHYADIITEADLTEMLYRNDWLEISEWLDENDQDLAWSEDNERVEIKQVYVTYDYKEYKCNIETMFIPKKEQDEYFALNNKNEPTVKEEVLNDNIVYTVTCYFPLGVEDIDIEIFDTKCRYAIYNKVRQHHEQAMDKFYSSFTKLIERK